MALFFASPLPVPRLHTHHSFTSPKRKRHAPRPTCASSSSATPPDVLVRPQTSSPAVIVRGKDRVSFVNGMGTNAFSESMKQPVQSVFTTNVGRCVDLVTAVQMDEHVLLLSSLPEGELYQYLDRYIFPADDVAIEDSPLRNAAQVMGKSAADVQVPDGMMAIPTVFGCLVMGDGNDALQGEWVSRVGSKVGDEEWEVERVQRGIPQLGVDITREQNALEAGLWGWVSFEKGCYIGQETIARQNTYNGVKMDLRAMQFEGQVAAGDAIEGTVEGGRKGGFITSVSVKEGRCRALGYVRRKSGLSEVGRTVRVGVVEGVVLEAPALSYGYEERSLLEL